MKKILSTLLCLLLVSPAIIRAQCNPQFSWTPAPSQNDLLKVDFYNTTTVPPQTFIIFSLNFGDNTPTQSYVYGGASHVYAAPGTYTAQLHMYYYDSLTQQVICDNTISQQVTVSYPACGTTITSVDNGSGSFTFTASNPANTSGLSYSWNFGDGNTGSGAVVNHTYTSPNSYNVTLNVTGANCSYGNETYVSTLANGINCDSLEASFTYTVYNNNATFTNTSTVLPYFQSLNIGSYTTWLYGDGNTGTGSYNNQHAYAAGGTYTVTMIHSYLDSMTQALLCTDSVSHQITVSNPLSQNFINGRIYFDSLNAAMFSDSFKVWLIAHDTVANTLVAIDSTTAYPYYPYFAFYDHSAGDYLIKAALMNQPAGINGLVPTYHDSSVYWSAASIVHHDGIYTMSRNIWMQSGTTTSGPGFIGGNISQGAGRGTGTGVPGMLIFLRDNSNHLVTSTYTDENGDYAFDHIPAGNYNVYPEAINYATVPSSALEIQSGNISRGSVDFEQSEDNIRPKGTVGISEKEALPSVDVYPNPARDAVFIRTINDQYNKATLMNTLGQVIATRPLHKGINSISTASLAPGMYYLMLSGKDISRSVKITRQ